ncbi:hypothetical protein ACGFI4_19725 [Micromonospora carbonacea]|jgi:hypothetical protein|uniref:Peptidase inhibitor family I36 n=1 Tax=Micromonospora carbonacea TaxID=47853 RepID=A0A1C4Z3B9_9ACTN|nr:MULTISPECIES: hypothetical protein [Micromonospora]MBB5829615.1 hypothetical protein [Micromonospora carbonacea]MDG4816467.1 hypothetical protein [Micromonospora sp. WMMD956]QLD22990.1 hypothetical protein HXZ27_00945 [Micromonospora carbonacea]SCF27460.1 hypothetical protein GA0070563_107217 [Micromonospora carbonacea]
MSSPVVRLLSTSTAAAVSALAVAAPAVAAPAQPLVAGNLAGTYATCYGGAVRSYFQTGSWGGEAGTYRTTSRCADVNVRNDSSFGTQACVVFVDKTNNCNYLTYLPAKSGWTTIATNVRDGVNFRVRFQNLRYEYEPLVAYHAF